MAKREPNGVMVAIETIDRSAVPLLKKAAAFARDKKQPLHLLHVIALPYAPVLRDGGGTRAALRQSIDDRKRALRKLAKLPQLRRAKVQVTVVWDYPAADAIVRQVMKFRPSLLIAGSQRHARLARTVLTNTDWDLIRNCPCPVLLSKSTRIAARPTVIAALDPFHAHAKPAGLDAAILAAAIDVAGSPARVLAFHAHSLPQPLLVEDVYEPYWVTMTQQELGVYEGKNRKALEAEASRAGLAQSNAIYVRGDPMTQLPRVAKSRRANIVAMGAVSRSGLKRLFIGNTAERLVDRLDCDVLIIKPRRFATPVPRRMAKLLPYPPYPIM